MGESGDSNKNYLHVEEIHHKGATCDLGQIQLNSVLNRLAAIGIQGLDQKAKTFISTCQRITYSSQLKHDYCLFRIKFLED